MKKKFSTEIAVIGLSKSRGMLPDSIKMREIILSLSQKKKKAAVSLMPKRGSNKYLKLLHTPVAAT